jgi:hypothetical protein
MGIGAHLVVAWQAHQIHRTLQHLLQFLLEMDGGVGGGGFATTNGAKQANAPEMKAISPALVVGPQQRQNFVCGGRRSWGSG